MTKPFSSAWDRRSRSAGGTIPRMNLTRVELGILKSYHRHRFCSSYPARASIFDRKNPKRSRICVGARKPQSRSDRQLHVEKQIRRGEREHGLSQIASDRGGN